LVVVGLGACAPAIPGSGAAPGDPTSSARDGGAVAPASAGGPTREPAAAAPSGPAAIPRANVPRSDAGADVPPADAGADVPRGDAAADVPRSDAGADVSPADAAMNEAAPEAPRSRLPRAGDVVIDELLVDPTGNDLGHEWIEIANVTSDGLDLATLHVSDGDTDVAIDAGLLPPGARLVLGQSLDRAHNGDVPVDRVYGTRLALNNGADRIALCLDACAGGLELDAFAWTMAWGEAYVGHAIVVSTATGATCPATEPYGTGGNFGSPGRPNPPCPTSTSTPTSTPMDAGAD
jgi:hypothetical protein